MNDLNRPQMENDTLNAMVSMPETQTEGGLPACCLATMRLHAAHNPMMMCPECKQVIKTFGDERAYRNYLTFCKTGHRKVFTTRVDGKFVITYKAYDMVR